MHELQGFYDRIGCARITLMPLCSAKRHFMTIDTTVLLNLLLNVHDQLVVLTSQWIQDVALYNSMCADAIDACREMWHKTFGLKTIKGIHRKTFDHQVDTNGISACIHFSIPKRGRSTEVSTEDHSPKTAFKEAERIIAIEPGRTNFVTAYD